MLQETWLLKDTLTKMNDLNDNYLSVGKTAVENNDILQGRPHGGVGFLWQKSLEAKITPVPVASNRITAISLSQPDGSKTLIVNVYMPCDNRLKLSMSPEYEKCIETLDELLVTASYNDVIIGGDLNTDYRRNNAHAKGLADFCTRNCLKDLWNENLCTDRVTYVSSDLQAKSCLDRFIMSRTLTVKKFGTIDEATNPSNHLPIQCTVKCYAGRIATDHVKNKLQTNIAWHKVSEYMYSQNQDRVTNCLKGIRSYSCLKCENLNCELSQHKYEIDHLSEQLEDVLITCANKLFPKTKSRHAKPFWKEKIKPLKDDSMFWHWVWRECGKPSHGVIADIYKNCKRRYHNAVKSLKSRKTP